MSDEADCLRCGRYITRGEEGSPYPGWLDAAGRAKCGGYYHGGHTHEPDAHPDDDMVCDECGGVFKRSEGFAHPPLCVYCGVARRSDVPGG